MVELKLYKQTLSSSSSSSNDSRAPQCAEEECNDDVIEDCASVISETLNAGNAAETLPELFREEMLTECLDDISESLKSFGGDGRGDALKRTVRDMF